MIKNFPLSGFGWSLDSMSQGPVPESMLIDITSAAQKSDIAYPVALSRRLWGAVGGGSPDWGNPRLKDLCWATSFALAGLTKDSEEFRPFARLLRFRPRFEDDAGSSRISVTAVLCRAIGREQRLLLLLEEELAGEPQNSRPTGG